MLSILVKTIKIGINIVVILAESDSYDESKLVTASSSDTSDKSVLPIASSNASNTSLEDDSNDNPATTSEGILNYIIITTANVCLFLNYSTRFL